VIAWHKHKNALGGAAGLLLLVLAFAYRWLGPSEGPIEGTAKPHFDASSAIQRALSEPRTEPPPNVGPEPTEAAPPSPTAPSEATKGSPSAPSLAQVSEEILAEVDDALASAQKAIKSDRLIAPPKDNALYWYDAALELDPGHKLAREGRKKLIAQLLEQADHALDAGDSKPAEELIVALDPAKDLVKEKAQIASRLTALPKIKPLLAEGEVRFQEGKLFEPLGASALDSYRAVLKLDPRHEAAKKALAEIEQGVLKQALALASQNDFANSDRLLALADSIKAGDATAAAGETRTRVTELKREYAQGLLARANAALDAHTPDAAEQLLKRAEELGLAVQEIEPLRTRLANARLYEHRNPGESFNDAFVDHTGNGPRLVVIPLGSFEMGSPEHERGRRDDESPRHATQMSRAFALGRTELTVGDFRRFVEATQYQSEAEKLGGSSYYDEPNGRISIGKSVTWQNDYRGEKAQDAEPVVHVSWNDAQAYLAWLGERTGKTYRLPTEAEFEYATRAGTATAYWWGDGTPARPVENLTGDGDRSPSHRSWTRGFARYTDGFWGPAPVARFAANPFGLFDISGNVSEWVEDCWHDSYLRAPADGTAWVNKGCDRRVIRGGSWGSAPEQVRSAARLPSTPDVRSGRIGFRIARDL
jgi:formylglycine-generating enzyme required for sulfatase activity